MRVLCRLAAAADARPKIIAKQEESSEEEEEDEELTPEEQGRHKLVFCGGGLGWVFFPFLWVFFPTNSLFSSKKYLGRKSTI